jgi:hypothetical protein
MQVLMVVLSAGPWDLRVDSVEGRAHALSRLRSQRHLFNHPVSLPQFSSDFMNVIDPDSSESNSGNEYRQCGRPFWQWTLRLSLLNSYKIVRMR